MRVFTSLVAVFAILFIGNLANAQCLNCQSVLVETVQVPTIQYETPVFQEFGPQIYQTVPYRTYTVQTVTTQAISAQCIGAAIDAFIAWKVANPDSGFVGGLAPAFLAYQRCSGQSRVSVRDALKIRQAVREKNTQINAMNRAPRARVRLFRR